MARGEAVGTRVVSDLAQPERDRVADQLSEDAPALRQRSDAAAGRFVDPQVQETLQGELVLVEDAEGGVLRPGEFLCRVEHLLEQVFQIELGDQRPADFQQAHQLRPG